MMYPYNYIYVPSFPCAYNQMYVNPGFYGCHYHHTPVHPSFYVGVPTGKFHPQKGFSHCANSPDDWDDGSYDCTDCCVALKPMLKDSFTNKNY